MKETLLIVLCAHREILNIHVRFCSLTLTELGAIICIPLSQLEFSIPRRRIKARQYDWQTLARIGFDKLPDKETL